MACDYRRSRLNSNFDWQAAPDKGLSDDRAVIACVIDELRSRYKAFALPELPPHIAKLITTLAMREFSHPSHASLDRQ